MRDGVNRSFHDAFVGLFQDHFQRLFRVIDRASGDPELAEDVVQESFIRLYRRGFLPDDPVAWLVSVAMNLMRNELSRRRRRMRLLTDARGEELLGDPPAAPVRTPDQEALRRRVRAALDGVPERERALLLLRAEGYSYREIARALKLNEASIGTLLARARRAFLQGYGEPDDAP